MYFFKNNRNSALSLDDDDDDGKELTFVDIFCLSRALRERRGAVRRFL